MSGRYTALCLAFIASAALTACAAPAECRAPLTQAECDDAVEQATDALITDPDVFARPSGEPERLNLTVVWKACSDPPGTGCFDEFEGFAFVRVATDAGRSLGRVIVCIDDRRCGDEGPSFGFP